MITLKTENIKLQTPDGRRHNDEVNDKEHDKGSPKTIRNKTRAIKKGRN